MPPSPPPAADRAAAGPEQLIVFVDARRVEVPAGASVLEALRVADASLAGEVAQGTRLVTDNRGLPIATIELVHGGTILRTHPTRGGAGDLDESER